MKRLAFALLTCLALAGPAQAYEAPDDGPAVAERMTPAAEMVATNTLGGVAPLTVTLATGHACPAPAQARDLLQLPEGCPSPWSGVLYTPQADQQVRADLAAVDRVCTRLDDELTRCRSTRTRLADDVLVKLPSIGAKLDTVATLLEAQPAAPSPAPDPGLDRPSPVPFAAMGAGGALGGAGLAYLLDTGPGRQLASAAGGAAIGIGAAVLFQIFDG